MGSTRVRVLLLLLFALCVASTGRAQPTSLNTAREHYRRGTTLYDLRRFHDAAKEYELAYEAKDDPALLFNIAQAYRFAGEYEDAIGAYRSYMRRLPNASNRAEVEARIAEMRKLLDERQKTQERPPGGMLPPVDAKIGESHPPGSETPAANPPQGTPRAEREAIAVAPANPGRSKRIAGLAVGGVGLGMLAAGIAMSVLAKSANDELTNPLPMQMFDEDLYRRGQSFDGAGIALLAIGGAAVATGVILYLLGHREKRHSDHAMRPWVTF